MKRNNKKGFTIVELVIVIAVIAILSAVLIPTFGGVTESARKNAALQEAKNAYTATITAEILDDADDVINGHSSAITVQVDDYVVSISTSGEPTIVKDANATGTYKIVNGKLVENK